MTKPVTIPNTFATATTAIPLSQLDGDFTAVATAINDANTYSNYAADTGSANAYVVTFSGVSTAYSAGLRIQFKAGNANTGASTINVNAQGAKSITYQDGNALASGTIAVNSIVDVMYDGTQFLLMNDPAGATGGDVTGPASATDNAVVRFDGTTGKLVQNSVVTIADSTGDISGVGQLNATTVDTTNLEVTNIKAIDGTAAASIANSTGVVSITANPVLSGGTANGVLYLNGSKVATSGSALTFDGSGLGINMIASEGGVTPALFAKQNSNGAFEGLVVRSSAAGGEILAISYDGSVFNHTASYVGTGGYVPLAWTVSGSEQMRLTSTGLGIGTSSPQLKLVVSNGGAAGVEVSPTGGNQGGTYLQAYNRSGTVFVPTEIIASKIGFYTGTSPALAALLDASGNLGLGGTAARATTVGTAVLNIFNGTAPVGTLTNGISLYSSSGEAYVMDAAGNATLFSPHDAETNEWVFKSKHTPTGKVLKIDVEKLLRFVNDHFGLDAVHEFVES